MKWFPRSNKKANPGSHPLTIVPKHVAFIMDGNGRWAKRRGLPRHFGHQAGVEAMRRVIEASKEFGLEAITLYAFSTENWTRPRDEVDFLMRLPIEYIRKDLPSLMKNNIRLVVSGRMNGIPPETQEAVQDAMQQTASNTGLTVNIALNYGGRAEIADALRIIASKVKAGELKVENIDEQLIGQCLYAPYLPDPDIIVRASGEQRLSNFLIWESAYAELYFSEKFWPDFGHDEVAAVLASYQNRDRRFGGLKS